MATLTRPYIIFDPVKFYEVYSTANKVCPFKRQKPTSGKMPVNKKDRAFQIWKRNPLSIELSSQKVFLQKLEYIHDNPVNAGLTIYPEAYHYSSASFYETGVDHYKMLTHYMG